MNCSEVRALFSQYLEDDVDELTRKRIDQHMIECTACKNELSIFAASIKIINARVKMDTPREYLKN